MFRFEDVWIGEEGCNRIIEQAWHSRCTRDSMKDVLEIIRSYNQNLGQWNRHNFGNVQRQLEKAKMRLQEVQSMDHGMPKNEVIKEA